MKRHLLILLSILVTIIVIGIITCNIIVVQVSNGKCYDDISAIPHRMYGLLLGTGRGSAHSPYFEARVQAAIDLYQAGKVETIIISGENLYEDYYEVDSMAAALRQANVPVALMDIYGTDTYTSLRRIKTLNDDQNGDFTVISQHFHNQRAVFYGSLLFDKAPIAYNAADADIWYWNIWRLTRESLARVKAVMYVLYI